VAAEDPSHTIRIAGIRDAALLSQLGARTFREAFGRFIPPMDLDSYISATYNPARQMDELTNPLRKFLIAEREGIAVGYALLHAHEVLPIVAGENPIELERLYLLQDSIGRGLGCLLMCKCIEESRRSAHKSMWLQVWERNERAISFYRKWGFEGVGIRSKELGKSIGKDLIMARKI
jgi:ribosomal protein S18 acetylase RimI-like enzyme